MENSAAARRESHGGIRKGEKIGGAERTKTPLLFVRASVNALGALRSLKDYRYWIVPRERVIGICAAYQMARIIPKFLDLFAPMLIQCFTRTGVCIIFIYWSSL